MINSFSRKNPYLDWSEHRLAHWKSSCSILGPHGSIASFPVRTLCTPPDPFFPFTTGRCCILASSLGSQRLLWSSWPVRSSSPQRFHGLCFSGVSIARWASCLWPTYSLRYGLPIPSSPAKLQVFERSLAFLLPFFSLYRTKLWDCCSSPQGHQESSNFSICGCSSPSYSFFCRWYFSSLQFVFAVESFYRVLPSKFHPVSIFPSLPLEHW